MARKLIKFSYRKNKILFWTIVQFILFLGSLFLSELGVLRKDLHWQISWGITAIICLFVCVTMLLIRKSNNDLLRIMDRIENGNGYERHVIKRLHDELIKKEESKKINEKNEA